ncbi:SRPBCC family protein [Nocardia sp. 004]|uniref:SRPBCC family protein n=1 Tax=Nocardia sp. 004 TaxID=3385978 RepID=UPI00399FBB22
MVHVAITVRAAPEQIFAVLSDGWLYSSWLVGVTHVRAVDETWPATGSRIHYSIGAWPFTVKDTAEVILAIPPYRLELEATVKPLGSALIRIGLWETRPGETHIRMYEHLTRGPGIALPRIIQGLLLAPRNQESLSRLAALTIGRERTGTAHTEKDPDRSDGPRA